MKFSQRRKNKMHKYNQRRINRCCKNMIGCQIDFENEQIVEDQAKVNGTMYLLARSKDDEYAIYKIVKVGEYVKLSEKKVLQNKKAFSNHAYWKKHSTIRITPNGKIESVRCGTYKGPYNARYDLIVVSLRVIGE